MAADQLELVPAFAVHCFLITCNHVVRGQDPQSAHDEMEKHYASRHRALIDAATA